MILFTFIKNIFRINERISHPIEKEEPESMLDDPDSKIWFAINLFIIFLIFVSIGFIIYESIWDNGVRHANFLFIVDWIISSIFAIEYFYRLYYAREKFRFTFKVMNVIDLLAFFPFFLEIIFTGLIDMTFLKALRILRVFRIFKLIKHFRSIWFLLNWLKNYKAEYQVWWILVIIVLLLSAILIYNIEWDVNEWFSSIPKTLWWSVVTMTTVWYWDTYPITAAWKVFWAIVILIWPMFIAMISSITVLVFFEVAEKNRKAKVKEKMPPCPRCFTNDNPIDSNYCRKCWKKLLREFLNNNKALS